MSRRGKRRLLVVVGVTAVLGVAGISFKAIRTMQQNRIVADARQQGTECLRGG